MRLVIDARMAGYSGIGTYIANVLPGILSLCAELKPILIALPQASRKLADTAGSESRILEWNATPLTWAELSRPPVPAGDFLWWAPHFNVPLLRSGPLVVTLHDLLPLADSESSSLHKMATRVWVSRIRRRARRVICVSEFTRSHAIDLGIERAITRVIPHGVHRAARPEHASPAPPYLLFVGMMKPHKNVGGLLRAFETIMNKIPHRLVIVGKQRGLRDIDSAALAHAARLGARVELREDVPGDELEALFHGADLLIQPSFFEGFGLPPLEAMAAGTPVLAARAGALPEVCGDAARYCDPLSDEDIALHILEIVASPELRARMRANGLARAAQYSWDLCAARTATVLLEAAKGTPVTSTG